MAPFAELRLTDALAKADWVNAPAVFTEQLTAHLWTTHQIDVFRAAAVDYVGKSSAALPEGPLPTHRLGIVVIGQGVRNSEYRLFRKLRPHGMYFTQVKHAGGLNTLASAVAKRAAAHPTPYGHWYIDGGDSAAAIPGSVARVSYAELSPVRTGLAAPHAEVLRGQRVRSGGVSNEAGADAAGRAWHEFRRRRRAEAVSAESADRRIGYAGVRDYLRAMGGAGDVAARAAPDAVRALCTAPAREPDE